MESLFPEGSPAIDAVTIFFGANDSALPDQSAARQHVPVDEYKANLTKMVAFFRGKGVRSIVIITPPPVCETGRRANLVQLGTLAEGDSETPSERNNSTAGRYASAACEVRLLSLIDVYIELLCHHPLHSSLPRIRPAKSMNDPLPHAAKVTDDGSFSITASGHRIDRDLLEGITVLILMVNHVYRGRDDLTNAASAADGDAD